MSNPYVKATAPQKITYARVPEGVVGVGVGGVFDFLTGVQKRAPGWMQQAGLEWFYRLLREPRRWRRQLALIQFVFTVMLKST